MEEVDPLEERECREEDEYSDEPKMKRKKTVTWADGELGSEGNDGSDVDVQFDDLANDDGLDPFLAPQNNAQQVVDQLYAAVDETAIQRQQPIPKTEPESLNKEQLLQRRLERLDNLINIYKDEYWALADELQIKHGQYAKKYPGTAAVQYDETPIKELQNSIREKAAAAGSTEAAPDSSNIRRTWESINPDREGQLLPSYEEVERLVIAAPPLSEDAQLAQKARLVKQKQQFLERLALIGRMEGGALASIGREMEARTATAALCGSKNIYYMLRTAITLGRKTSDQQHEKDAIDIDLGTENQAAARAVSRRQAQIYLDISGTFKLINAGRRALYVNNRMVSTGQVVDLPNLSLITVSGMSLMFVVNQMAINRALDRGANLNVH